jgi:hypothetical protein
MRVVRVTFTATRLEADEAVFVVDDHSQADYAAYPVNAIDAERKVFRTDNPREAAKTVVMTGDSQNPYAEYSGGTYNVGGKVHGEPSRSPKPKAAPRRAVQLPAGPKMTCSGCLSSLIVVPFLVWFLWGAFTFDANKDNQQSPPTQATQTSVADGSNTNASGQSSDAAPDAESAAADTSGVGGKWAGPYGTDMVREILVLSQDTPTTFSGTSNFENDQGDEYGSGTVEGTISGSSVNFILKREGGTFVWSGTFDEGAGELAGTFEGYSNDATYER